MLLDMYPEAKSIIVEWLEANLSTFSCESLENFVRNELGSKLYDVVKTGQPLTFDEFANSINLSTFGVSTAQRYINLFCYKWSQRKKSYYNDKHENEENVRDRIEFIRKHREYEQDTHVWVQISDERATYLEENESLLPGVAAHCHEGMREYHIETHPSFLTMKPGLSVRKPMNSRPKIIYGQDETVAKSNIYSNRCWHNPSGASQLLPKSDGYALMISALISRFDGLGAEITQQQLDEINDSRDNGDWCEYISRSSAMEVYGTTKKKKLTCKHALIQYFELGVQNEGYWDFNHMALQMEDAYDVLQAIHPHCDFVVEMDRSAGHGKKREDGLDANIMKKKWGGGKDNMRDTIVPENAPYGATHLVGSVQHMHFQEIDEGPFDLSPQQR